MNDDWATQLERRIDGEAAEAGPTPPEIEALASVAAELRLRLSPAAPTAPQRARVWAKVEGQLRADSSPLQARRPGPVLRPAYALAAIGLAVVLMGGTTAAYASEAALPGDPLYPVKRSLEAARLALSLTEEGDANLAAAFADRRLDEIESLSAVGRWGDVEEALGGYSEAVDRLAGLEAPEAEASLTHHLEVLERVRSRAPDAAQPGLLRALERASHKKDEARDRRQDGESPPGDPDRGRRNHPPRGPGGLPPGLEKKLTPTP